MGLNFGHLLGFSPKRLQAEDEDEQDKKAKRAEKDDDENLEDEEEKKTSKAEGDKDDPSAEEPDKDTEEDDPDAEEEEENKEAKKARVIERKRCAAIFSCKAAAQRPDLAAHLAFNTGQSAKAAVELLNATVQGMPKNGLHARMGQQKTYTVGLDNPEGEQDQATRMISLYQKYRGGKQ